MKIKYFVGLVFADFSEIHKINNFNPGLQKLLTQPGAGKYWVPKLYWTV